jgi:hypothetical protein
VGVPALADAGGFTFTARHESSIWTMGDHVARLPGLRLQAGGALPAGARLRLLHDGRILKEEEGTLQHVVEADGVYRVEVRVPGWSIPWVLSNPIYVMDEGTAELRRTRSRWPDEPPAPAAVTIQDAFEATTPFIAGADPTSLVDPTVVDPKGGVGGGGAARLAFRLQAPGPGQPHTFCSLVDWTQAARELTIDGLPPQARTWVNQRLKFTHGYGATVSLVNSVADEGRPSLVVQDVPPSGEIPITRPEIYYGTRPSSYVILKTNESEFDYPRGEENAQSFYEGETGVNLGSWINRLAYAALLRDGNILLSSSLGPESTIVYRRNIQERIRRVAPFLLLDRDPYVVIMDGRLVWLQDAYTFSADFPYSEPTVWPTEGTLRVRLNYIRNSVKVAVDAYDGSMSFYAADANDPILASYQSAFPALFRPLSDMPATLREHLRYPEDIFTIQAERYSTFHMTDPAVFYNREDQWAFAKEKFYASEQLVEPYFVIMRLDGEQRSEFLQMLPFTPRGKDNMIAWLAARSDEPNYGKLVVYKFPKDKLVYGPFQVEGRIDQDPVISSQFTLWSQSGSRIIRGNLLVIPVGRSSLYVEPIYLQAQNGPIPELRRVILSTGNRLVMEPTLEEAVAKLFGTAGGQPSLAGPQGAVPGASATIATDTDVAVIIRSARARFDRSQEALRAGDWARYGEEQRALEAELRRLAELTGQAP